MTGNFKRENREIPRVSLPQPSGGERSENASGGTADMHARGKSDGPIVPAKPANKADPSAAESVEERGSAEGNVDEPTAHRTPRRNKRASRGLFGVREAAERDGTLKFTALLHHVGMELLRASFFELKRNAAPGVDEVTWHEYEQGLEARLTDLHTRVHRGTYRARPSKRVWIPKSDGRQRPLGIASLEDKIVQRALRTVLEQIYETDFKGFSYGFRPRRGCHNALDALVMGLHRRKINWVLDADIRGFFDNISHEWLMKFLEHRIADKRVLRLIRKWLRAGVSEDGTWSRTTVGTPQGAVISPLLANVYLHYVLDWWIDWWRKNHATGDVIVVRYADDFVVGFQRKGDAVRCWRELGKRFAKFGLELHPDKTRLLEFGRFARQARARRGEKKPETFDFLGFTHQCGLSRNGRFLVRRAASAKRMRGKLSAIKTELRRRMHRPLGETGRWLRSVVRGWLNYYAVPHSMRRLRQFYRAVIRHWLGAIRRRSQKGRDRWNWSRMLRLASRWLPCPKILHPHPSERLRVRPKAGAV